MGFNKANKLKRIIKIQDIYLKHKEPYITNRYIFDKFILPQFDITERTFYNYLNEKNPKKQLEKIELNKPKAKKYNY